MVELLTLIHSHGSVPSAVAPGGYRLRPCRADDIEQLGRLYFDCYDPGQACSDLPEAVADIRAAFAGDYGPLWPAASPVATALDGQVVAAILVVDNAPWPDTPDCPFAIELFTARAHRRQGLARSLVLGALTVIADTGPPHLALRVSPDNHAALTLYHVLGFRNWTGDTLEYA